MSVIETFEIKPDTVMPENFQAVFEAWRALPNSPDLPLSSGFSLELVPSKLLPWSVLVDVESDPLDFRFRFWGTERTNLIGAEMTGKLLSSIGDETMREGNRDEYVHVCERCKPLLCHTPILTQAGLESSRVSIRLPLSKDGKTVSQVFSAINPEDINDDHYAFYGTTPKKGL